MSWPDLINCTFECLGGLAVLASCYRTYKSKSADGVSLITIGFFTSWGFWNLYYYPSLGQVVSGVAAIGVCAANSLWWSLAWRYRVKSSQSSLQSVPSHPEANRLP